MEKIYEGTFILVYKETVEGRKTPIYYITNWDDIRLGEIKWYQSWRKFCFYPAEKTVWDNKCIKELYNILLKINKDYLEENKKQKETKTDI